MAEEKILKSSYPSVAFPKLSTVSAVEFILGRSTENVKNGQVNWMTNSITGENLTLPELEPLSRKVASALVKRGMVKGDVVIYLTSDVTKIFAIVVGTWRAAGILYSSYPEDTTDTLLMRIKESKAKFLVCDPVSVPQCNAAKAQVDWPIEVFAFGQVDGATSVDELFKDDGEACPARVPDAKLDDPILVLCTSGTTGQSKGAVYTNKSLLGFCMSLVGVPKTPKPVMLLIRCTHVLGVLLPMRSACSGNWPVMMSQVTKQNIFNCVKDYKPVFAFGFPTFLLLLALDPEASKYDLSSIEIICTGGMIIPENFYRDIKTMPHVKHILNGLGLTECGVITTTMDLSGKDSIRAIPNVPNLTVGRLLPNTELKVLHLETGETLGPLERGEVAVKNPIMAIGYFNRPDETAATFKDGWMHTGDLGYYDEQGFVFIVDRIKETFKYYNNHISPADVEAVILTHPAVAEACVFGIVDSEGGDHIPRALVILKPGQKVDPNEIKEFANEKLAVYKKLRGGLYIVDAFPRGKTGKVLRSAAANLPLPNFE